MSATRWDVAVFGSGPAGCATALALSRAGIERVCIVDPDRCAGPALGETLPPEARLLLDRLGIWDGFLGEGHEPCLGSCSAWGSDALGYNDFVLNPLGNGWHLDRARFNAFLRRSAAARGVVQITSWNGSARYVIDATGVRAAVARRLGAKSLFLDRLVFVYGFFDAGFPASSSRLTMLEATEDGWWYAAALPGGRTAVAIATDPEIARAQRLSNEECWFAQLLRTRFVAPRLDGCRIIRGSLTIRAAPSFRLDRAAGARWLAVGDAAAGYDPLCGQGLYKAMANGIEAAAAVTAACASDREIPNDYAKAVADDFEAYRLTRNYFYGLETRWAGSPFWQRRHARGTQRHFDGR